MNDTLTSGTTVTTDDEQLAGLIEAMEAGLISSFEYGEVYVHRLGASVGVSPEGPPQNCEGGLFLLESGTIEGLKEWLNVKADHYGGSQ